MQRTEPLLDGPRLVRWKDTVDSTNTYAMARIHTLPHGGAVVAKQQTAGRGRQGRAWRSPPGGLYMTVVLREQGVHLRLSWLPLIMACAVCDELELHGLESELKWPNDVLVGGRKIAGVLGEAAHQGDTLLGAVVGLGLNVNTAPEDLASLDRPATSMIAELGRALDLERVAIALRARFLESCGELAREGPAGFRRRALERAAFLGRPVAVRAGDGVLEGRAVDLDLEGRLVLEREDGSQVRATAGELAC